jgi:hypothetical protein
MKLQKIVKRETSNVKGLAKTGFTNISELLHLKRSQFTFYFQLPFINSFNHINPVNLQLNITKHLVTLLTRQQVNLSTRQLAQLSTNAVIV